MWNCLRFGSGKQFRLITEFTKFMPILKTFDIDRINTIDRISTLKRKISKT